jgi:hypothetical protein
MPVIEHPMLVRRHDNHRGMQHDTIVPAGTDARIVGYKPNGRL